MSLLAIGCSPPAGPTLTISDMVVLEPLPGTSTTAGYLTLTNNGNEPIAIENVMSPQFARIEMHETIIEDGVARMESLVPLIIAPHSSVRFAPGGKHLMMSGWTQEIMPGMPVSIEFGYATNGLLIVQTTVSRRVGVSD